jgi:hemerythrin-like domain-containing protein
MNESDERYALSALAGWTDVAASVRTVDALSFLRSEHRELLDLFDDFRDAVESAADEPDRWAAACFICTMLEHHAQIEEELFYPPLRAAAEHRQLLDEARVEHDSARQLIAQIREGGAANPLLDALVNVLGEYVQHHIREEEDEIFQLAESSELKLDELGAVMDARKQELASAAVADA